ncbi:MAG TPA: RNA polymerase sigma factor [Sedimentisphaerales bacterium]|nr:RNA polymerase sigma factor [Sedimentisphaerales bacterium]
MNSRIKTLCKRAKKADKDAACELLKIHYADIYSYLRRLCGSRHDAEDLTQQTFLKVWSSLDSFAGRSRFSTWLYRIAHNTYLDWLRRNITDTQCRPDQCWQECIDENPGPFANLAEQQLAQRLYKAVDRLDEDKKHVVHLHYYQGLSIRETATVLNIATSTVKYRLREVFKILRATIGVEENDFNRKQTIPIAKGESLWKRKRKSSNVSEPPQSRRHRTVCWTN